MPYVQPSPPTTRTRILGLDGLRALAALLVLIFHLFPRRMGSGYVGVDMFFVLSGFLITALLLRERNQTGRTDLRAFWVRRVRRLVPAVAVATVGSIALARCFGGDSLVQLRWQTLGALTGTYNWLEVLNGSSYFEQQSPLLLTNVWSLAVEQQFYLFWPLLLLLIIHYLPRRYAPYVTLGLGSVSVVLHVIYVTLDDDVTRAYVGTDSHLFGLAVGAAIALWVPRVSWWGPLRPAPSEEKRMWGILAWAGLVGALAIGILVPDGPWMYPWGLFAVAACTGSRCTWSHAGCDLSADESSRGVSRVATAHMDWRAKLRHLPVALAAVGDRELQLAVGCSSYCRRGVGIVHTSRAPVLQLY